MTKPDITVGFWNILTDVFQPSRVATQTERLPSIITELQKLPSNTIFGLAELERESATKLASSLQRKITYAEQERDNTNVAALYTDDSRTDVVVLSSSRHAIIVHGPIIQVAIVHLTFSLYNERLHIKQLTELLSHLDLSKPTIIMGDFNSPGWGKSRRFLVKQGFLSALPSSLLHRVITVPTKQYSHLYPAPFNVLSKIGFKADDIYVRGLNVIDSGMIESESDHKGVWAECSIKVRIDKTLNLC